MPARSGVAGKKAVPSGEGFAGFGPKALGFLKALGFHQNREWFLENKHLYESDVREPMGLLVTSLSVELAERGIGLSGDPKRSVFRIHRDVRFTKEKHPYKTHCGAALSRDGSKNSNGILYIHVAPEGSFAAAGFYRPEPPQLAAMRGAIAKSAKRWRAIEQELEEADLVLSREDAMTRLPRGFEHTAGTPLAETLKLRSFILRRELPAAALHRPTLVTTIADFTAAAEPLLKFGWTAIDRADGAAKAEAAGAE
jgi:uncharacterized protein (TIGR02453 family)